MEFELSSATHVVPSPLLSIIFQQSGCPLVHEVKSLWNGAVTVAHSVLKGTAEPYTVVPSLIFIYERTL